MKHAVTVGISLLVLGAAPVLAADIPVKVRPVAPIAAPVYSWTGCHIGAQGGVAIGRSRHVNVLGVDFAPEFDIRGGLFGGEAGCSYQFASSWAIGFEGDYSWANKRGSALNTGPAGNNIFFSGTREKALWTVRGRVGPTWDRLWLYATGGAAGASIEATVDTTAWPGSAVFPTTLNAVYSETQTRWGWTVGAGLEYAFAQNWSLKGEYLYVKFPNRSYFVTNPLPAFPGFVVTRDVSTDDHIFRVGLNYRFSFAGPVVAKY
jgi:outer membrane immunogenic protein